MHCGNAGGIWGSLILPPSRDARRMVGCTPRRTRDVQVEYNVEFASLHSSLGVDTYYQCCHAGNPGIQAESSAFSLCTALYWDVATHMVAQRSLTTHHRTNWLLYRMNYRLPDAIRPADGALHDGKRSPARSRRLTDTDPNDHNKRSRRSESHGLRNKLKAGWPSPSALTVRRTAGLLSASWPLPGQRALIDQVMQIS